MTDVLEGVEVRILDMKRLHVRLTTDQIRILRERSAATGLSVTAMVRELTNLD
jgi:hypothetical protein